MKRGWIDSHVHLAMYPEDELEGVIKRALDAGVTGMLAPASEPEDIDRTLEISARYPCSVLAAIGIHPHEASSLDDTLKRKLEKSLAIPGVAAVGEIGLDYHYMNSPKEDQIAAFRWQLQLAADGMLPVVVHCREAWDDAMQILKEFAGKLKGVLHSFSGSSKHAIFAQDIGFLVGISGMITFKNASALRKCVANLIPEQVIIETDAPFLAPVPFRGKRNEPAYLPLIAEKVAELLELKPTDYQTIQMNNFLKLVDKTSWPC